MKLSLYFLLTLLAVGCDSSDDRPDCSAVACTLEFRTLTVSVSDPSGVAIPLESYQVIRVADGADVTPEYSPENLESYQNFNAYPILTDARGADLRNKRVELEFRGFANGTLVASRTFLAGADCCHVAFFQGDTDIVVN